MIIAFAKREHAMLFSLCGTFLSAALFIAINIITTQRTIWAIYPIFALIWWPISIYYFVYKPQKITESKNIDAIDNETNFNQKRMWPDSYSLIFYAILLKNLIYWS